MWDRALIIFLESGRLARGESWRLGGSSLAFIAILPKRDIVGHRGTLRDKTGEKRDFCHEIAERNPRFRQRQLTNPGQKCPTMGGRGWDISGHFGTWAGRQKRDRKSVV